VLGRLLALQFPNHERVCIAVIHNKKGIQGAYFSYNHDYAYFCIPPALTETHGTVIPEEQWEFDNLRKWGRESERHTARHCFYPIFVKGNRIAGFGDICRDDFHPGAANIRQRDQVAIYPVDSQGVERKWRYSRQSVEGISPLLRVHVVKGSGEVQIHKAKAEKAIKTVWDDPKYIAGDYGTKWLTDLGLKISQNLYPKSVHTVEDSIFAVSNPDSLILDYFAGTGTTGHAVINLNRRDGGRRKFILVDMAEYFDTVLVSRLKKVMFTPVWKNGKPTRLPTKEEADRTPRLVKVLRLESYEDALHNTFSDDAVGRLTEREKAHQDAIGDEEYRIRYLVQLPLEASHSMLSLARLEHPFDYTLEVLTDYGPKTKTVDLVETFNWLYGLRAQRVLTRVNPGDTLGKDRNGRSYRVVVASDRDANTRILVVWRDMTGLDPTVERPFLEAQAKALGPFDEQWINGDTSAQGFASLNGLFKRLMEDGSR
jgi:adenine-specific DNA-methyltransferase